MFEEEGLEGASLRAIAARAGYTPAALYFHFDSREAIYAELLRRSLDGLGGALRGAAGGGPDGRLARAAMAFFDYYAAHPRELDLGFYLFRGGMRPSGLSAELDRELNQALAAALSPLADAAVALGATTGQSRRVVVDAFAYATGLLMLQHTGRIRMFGVSAREMMLRHADELGRRFALDDVVR